MGNTLTADPTTVYLSYTLAELPTSQHRAGLVGLIMLLQDLEKSDCSNTLVKQLTETGAQIALNEDDLKILLDEVYAASEELQGREAPFKGVEPTKVEELEVIDPKNSNKTKLKKLYFYPQIVPKGAFLDRYDQSQNKVWIKLWRDLVWQIMRGVPATRRPYEDRALGKDCPDVKTIWKQISREGEKSIELASTYFIGAQAANAERVSFKDQGRFQFLLHFWIFATQIYIPQSIDRDGKRVYDGFCLAVPDVSMLKSFCDDYRLVLRRTAEDNSRYRPKDAIIEIPEEAGLDTIRRLTQVIKASSAKLETRKLLFGIDIFHMARDGNNVRLLYSGRVEPERERDRDFAQIKELLKDSFFKRQRIVNLLRNQSWYQGFDKLLSTLPLEQGLLSQFFSIDAQKSFAEAKEKHKEEMMTATGSIESEIDGVCLESLVLQIIKDYLRSKLKTKHNLEWSKEWSKDKTREFNEKREHIGKDCFYAIRSRTGEDFINYFASSICSVPQWMSREQYLKITSTLYDNPEKVRTLSMIALSTCVGRPTEKKGDE